MRFNPDLHHRQSRRMQGYDYRRAGAYFITIVTANRECLFGEMNDGTMYLNASGCAVQSVWFDISANYPKVSLDAYVVMPNHFNGLVVITDSVGAIHESPGCLAQKSTECIVQPPWAIHESPLPMTIIERRNMVIPKLIGQFKMQTAKQINALRATPGKPLWQRNYWDRIVRHEPELQAIRAYIRNNPHNWSADQ